MDRKFRSKVDGWYYITVIAFTVIPILWLIQWIARGGSFLFAAVIFIIADFGVIYPVFLDTAYTFERDGLRVKAGLILNVKLAYRDITDFYETTEAGSSPALSRDRVRINFSTDSGTAGRVLVSPAQKAAFLEILTEKTEPFKNSDQEV
ncbi:MAG: hypothetical protein EOM54_13640 [Clostridia bacterium]|nr:hypothetical protein [Clostridia bacterium]